MNSNQSEIKKPFQGIANGLSRKQPLFGLGMLVATPGAISMMERLMLDASQLLQRHVTGDWGDLDHEDRKANDDAVQSGARIFSSYLVKGEKLYVITEACNGGVRESTCILRPSEY